MRTKIMITLSALAGAAAWASAPAVAHATAGTTGPASGRAAACEVQHDPWYTRGGYRHVVLRNECGTKKTVCIAIPRRPASFPIPRYTLKPHQNRDVAYAPTSINEGTSVYYC